MVGWSTMTATKLFEYGLTQSQHDASVFYSTERQLFCAIHVDDITATGPDKELAEFETFLRSKFELSSSGTIKDLLGMEVEYNRDKGYLSLDQTAKVEALLGDMAHHLEGRSGKRSPVNVDLRLVSPEADKLAQEREALEKKFGKSWERDAMPYRSVLGSVQHIMVSTRPEPSFAISYLSRFMSCFVSEHWNEAVRLLQYLKGNRTRKLVISRDKLKSLTLSAG